MGADGDDNSSSSSSSSISSSKIDFNIDASALALHGDGDVDGDGDGDVDFDDPAGLEDALCIFEDQAGVACPPVKGSGPMRGLVYVVRSVEYPVHLVQVQVEKLRARTVEDDSFHHGTQEVRRLLE